MNPRDLGELDWRKSSFSASETNCVELAWRKSSSSASQTNCVEVGWRKSSFSGTQTNCVEVGWPELGVAVRDSKKPDGPVLLLDRLAVSALVATLRRT